MYSPISPPPPPADIRQGLSGDSPKNVPLMMGFHLLVLRDYRACACYKLQPFAAFLCLVQC